MSGALAAIVNAIVDGLSPLGLVRLDIPATQNLPRDAEKLRSDRADPSPNPPVHLRLRRRIEAQHSLRSSPRFRHSANRG